MPTSRSCCVRVGMDGSAFVVLGALVSSRNSAGKFLLPAGRAGVCPSPCHLHRACYSAEPLVQAPVVLRAGLSLKAVPVISDRWEKVL